MRPSEDGSPRPVPNQWIVLHRVGTDRAAPMDSLRSDASGRYRFRYIPTGDPQALYFVSARYAGIAYFSPPLRRDTVRGDDADIVVYDTTTDSAAVTLQGRHFVVSAPRGQRREVAEVFELSNSGFRTLVARDSSTPHWSLALPPRAESASVAPGDITAAAVVFRNGRAELYAPVSPGVRQLVLTYLLPIDQADLTLPVERTTRVLEVLLEEPRGDVGGARLEEVAPGVIEGRQFRRFLAQDVPASGVFRITLPRPPQQNRGATVTLAVVVALAMLGALSVWFVKKRRSTLYVERSTLNVERSLPEARASDRLLLELATLDARAERSTMSDTERADYQAKRGALKAGIERALAEEQSRA